MVQATTIQKTGRRFGFLNGIFGSQRDGAELRKDIEFLVQDYTAFTNLAANLVSHSRWIPYPFIIEHTRKIADELRNLADILRMKINELGGEIPSDASKSSTTHNDSDGRGSQNQKGHDSLRQNIKRLVADMEEHSSRYEALHHQRNLITDVGVSKLIKQMIVEMQRQKDELIDIVMRIS
jgi:hypothetical protein